MDTWCLTQWKHCKALVIYVQTKQFPLSNVGRIKAKCYKFLLVTPALDKTQGQTCNFASTTTSMNPDSSGFYLSEDTWLWIVFQEKYMLGTQTSITLAKVNSCNNVRFRSLMLRPTENPLCCLPRNWKGVIYIFNIICSVSLVH